MISLIAVTFYDIDAVSSIYVCKLAKQSSFEILVWLFIQVATYFNDAAKMSPDDADVHIVLGVLYNLSREYDRAIESFQTALKLKPRDYSLWNKLGATQANSVQSADAILAYQHVISSFFLFDPVIFTH